MKVKRRLPAILIAACAALTLATAAGYPELQAGNYKPADLGVLHQSAPAELSTDSVYAAPAYPLYPPKLAEGDGKQVVESYCAMCHSPRYVTMQPPLPAATWEAEVNKMNTAFGARIPEAVSRKIIEYLQTHYTPETRKP